MFGKYHYLNHGLNKAAQEFVAFIDQKPVGFCAALHMPHPRVKNFKRLSRLVVLPDYQGVGVGRALSDWVCKYYKKAGNRVIVTSSNPAMCHYRKNSPNWRLTRVGRAIGNQSHKEKSGGGSGHRITYGWEYVG